MGVDLSNSSSPTMYEVEFHDGRKIQTTRKYSELEEAPHVFGINTKARTVLEDTSGLSKKYLQAILNPEVLTPV